MQSSFGIGIVGLALLAASASAQQLLRNVNGSAGDKLGASGIAVGDQNGDGYVDVLVGAPGVNGGRGAVQCVSGKFLAVGTLPQVLWSASPTSINAGAAFGTSLTSIGNLTGNSATDFVVGAPNYIPTGAFDYRGAIFLVDGSTHAVVNYIEGLPLTHFGQALVSVGDQTGDFKADIAVSAPDVSTSVGSIVHIVPGAAFGFATQIATVSHSTKNVGWHGFGGALASGFDYNGDGKFDVAISIPDFGFNNAQSGWVEVCRADTLALIQAYAPNTPGDHFGASLDASSDFDGDGMIDLVVGAPNYDAGGNTQVGHALVISGAQFVNPNLPGPHELFTLELGFSSLIFDFHLGATVRAGADLDHDGVKDILVGAPDYTEYAGGLTVHNKGMFAVFSGATGLRMGLVTGSNTDHLGDAIVGAVDDFDSDGFVDFVAGGSLSDAGGTDSGTVQSYRLFPATPSTYCTGKMNSLGCVPAMSWNGVASVSSSSSFLITCSNVINQATGLLMYSHAPNASAFQGGTLCVKAPLRRTATQNSGGSASGTDCTGAYSFDFNAQIDFGGDPTLVIAEDIYTQYWSRDSASPSTTSLSNALHFLINP